MAVAVAYVAAAWIGFRFAFAAEQVTTVWAPSGISIAALLLFGRGMWPAIWLGAFAANAGTAAPLWTAAAVATGNTLEAVVAAGLLQRLPQFHHTLRRVDDALAFLAIGGLASTGVSATIGVLTLCWAEVQPWARFGLLWRDWWLGDAVGVIIVGPAILTAAGHRRWSRHQLLDAALLVGGSALTTHLIFGQLFGFAGAHPLEYAIFPFIVAAAMRSGQPTTSLAVLAASTLSLQHTLAGEGPFAGPLPHESLLLLQAFMGVMAITGLVLAAASAERDTGDRRRAAAYSVGEILATAPDLSTIAPAMVRALCRNLEWQVGSLWVVDKPQQVLQCLAVHAADHSRGSDFVALTTSTQFRSGVGLPGRVWASGQTAWIDNVVLDDNFPRKGAADAAGLHGAFGFPIRVGSDVIGVIECFNSQVLPPDPDLLRTMSAVGNQIGQFVGRKREEAAVAAGQREREQLLHAEARARTDAEAANRAKDEFLATLSHELRTPLNAIVGWTRLLLEGRLDSPSARRALEVIDRNAQLQTQLIGDILDVSRIISGGLRLNLRPVDLEAVVGAAVDAVRPAAAAKRVAVRSRLAASAGVVEGDPQRLEQVIWNLLSNAVKFTEPDGTVVVEVVEGPENGIRVRVIDDGVGIDAEFLPYVFDRFRQADGSLSRRHGGLGLGLAIVRHLVELHGGSVRADSAGPNMGSTFTVDLPRLRELATASTDVGGERAPREFEQSTPKLLRGYRLLVVDDHEDTRELTARLLSGAGAHVETASSVREALHRLELNPPDALLADIGMPGADGYDLIREVRRRDRTRGYHLQSIAVTAYASEGDRDRALATGFDAHLAKPVDATLLVSTLLEVCPARLRDLRT